MFRTCGIGLALLAGALSAGPSLAATEDEAASRCMNKSVQVRQELDEANLPPTQRADVRRTLGKAREHAEGGDAAACRDALTRAEAQFAAARRGETVIHDDEPNAPESSQEIPAGDRPTTTRGLTTGPTATPHRPEVGNLEQNTVKRQVAGLVESAGVTQVEGTEVATAPGEVVGEVEKVVQTPDGQETFLVVGTGGFLGLGDRDTVVPLSELDGRDGRFVLTGHDRTSIEQLPAYEEGKYVEVELPNVLELPSPEGAEPKEAPPVVRPE